MTEVGDTFGTDDLALATTLTCAGFEYELKRLNSTKAVWLFTPPVIREDEFYAILDRYEARTYTVEPWSYTIELSRTKGKLFDFLGRPGRSPASATTDD